jgi:hypothetical protein
MIVVTAMAACAILIFSAQREYMPKKISMDKTNRLRTTRLL